MITVNREDGNANIEVRVFVVDGREAVRAGEARRSDCVVEAGAGGGLRLTCSPLLGRRSGR